MKQEIINELLKQYEEKYPVYCDFSSRIKNILTDVLNTENLTYLSIESRTKLPVSLRQKLQSGVINVSSLEEIRDLVGVRVITYVYEDINSIEKLIRKNFDTKQLDTEEKLGVDKIGYRSHHWIISLPAKRTKLAEYKKFKNLKVELQVRTILQHAWAQIGHNQIYKPNVVLPDKITRDFTLLSGLLEIADNEFSRISREIFNYSNQVNKRTRSGDLDIPIDSVSLRRYFEKKFGTETWVDKKFGPRDDMIEKIIEELSLIGITNLKQLDLIIPKNLKDNEKKLEKETNYCGIARSIMVISKPELYFQKAWRDGWNIGPNPDEQLALYRLYGIDVEKLMNKYSMKKTVKLAPDKK